MKILVFGLSSQLGGVESFIIENCSSISTIDPSINFEFIVIDSIPEYISNSQIRDSTFLIVPNRVQHPLNYNNCLNQIIEKGRYDCVWYNVCTLSDVTLLKKATDRIPIRIVHAHSSKYLGSFANRILHDVHKRKIRNLATEFAACSLDAGKFMFPYFNPKNENDFIYKNSIDVRKFQRNKASIAYAKATFGLTETPVFLHIGRFSPEKNHIFMLELIDDLKTRLPNAKLLLVGDGPKKEEITNLVKQKGLESSVIILGSRNDIPFILKAADVFLLPSLHEGFPISLLEAQSAGLQCLGSSNIPEDAFLTDRAQRLPLDTISVWTEACVASYENSKMQTDDCCQTIADRGYDIETNAEIMSEFLLGRAKFFSDATKPSTTLGGK